MALQLYMVGLTVKDMDRSLEFYRRLGLAVPQESEGQPHIEVKMQGDFTLFFDTRTIPREHPAVGEAEEKPRGAIFEYYLKTQAAVEAKYIVHYTRRKFAQKDANHLFLLKNYVIFPSNGIDTILMRGLYGYRFFVCPIT